MQMSGIKCKTLHNGGHFLELLNSVGKKICGQYPLANLV